MVSKSSPVYRRMSDTLNNAQCVRLSGSYIHLWLSWEMKFPLKERKGERENKGLEANHSLGISESVFATHLVTLKRGNRTLFFTKIVKSWTSIIGCLRKKARSQTRIYNLYAKFIAIFSKNLIACSMIWYHELWWWYLVTETIYPHIHQTCTKLFIDSF